MLMLGVQTVLSSFFLSVLGIKQARTSTGAGAIGTSPLRGGCRADRVVGLPLGVRRDAGWFAASRPFLGGVRAETENGVA